MLTQVPAEQKSFLTFNGFFTNINEQLEILLQTHIIEFRCWLTAGVGLVGWICGFGRLDLWIWYAGFVDLEGWICGFDRMDLWFR